MIQVETVNDVYFDDMQALYIPLDRRVQHHMTDSHTE